MKISTRSLSAIAIGSALVGSLALASTAFADTTQTGEIGHVRQFGRPAMMASTTAFRKNFHGERPGGKPNMGIASRTPALMLWATSTGRRDIGERHSSFASTTLPASAPRGSIMNAVGGFFSHLFGFF